MWAGDDNGHDVNCGICQQTRAACRLYNYNYRLRCHEARFSYSKTMDFVLKFMEFLLRLMDGRQQEWGTGYVSKTDEFGIKNGKLCTENEKFCIKNDEFCSTIPCINEAAW